MASSSAPPASGWEIETGLEAGFFTEAELAVADQLVQLSGSCGEAPSPSSSSSSLRSVNTYTAAAAWKEEEEEVVAPASRLGEELDRRARKRYRLLSDLYAATEPETGASAATSGARKRKRHGVADGKAMLPRYGDQSCY